MLNILGDIFKHASFILGLLLLELSFEHRKAHTALFKLVFTFSLQLQELLRGAERDLTGIISKLESSRLAPVSEVVDQPRSVIRVLPLRLILAVALLVFRLHVHQLEWQL